MLKKDNIVIYGPTEEDCAPILDLCSGLIFIKAIESTASKQAIRNNLPVQTGDALRDFSDVSELTETVYFKPKTEIEVDIEWYKEFYGK